jgi:hypothetical protein
MVQRKDCMFTALGAVTCKYSFPQQSTTSLTSLQTTLFSPSTIHIQYVARSGSHIALQQQQDLDNAKRINATTRHSNTTKTSACISRKWRTRRQTVGRGPLPITKMRSGFQSKSCHQHHRKKLWSRQKDFPSFCSTTASLHIRLEHRGT